MKGPEARTYPQCGVVSSVDLKAYRAKVYLPLIDHETDWIRIGSQYVGNGWGLRAPLHAGNEVMVVFANGDLNEGHIVCAFWSEGCDQTPQEDGAFALVHESGSVLRFDADGSILIKATNIAMEKG